MSEIFDIGKLLWTSYVKYRTENKSLDLFRILVKLKDLPAKKFAETIFDEFVPHVLKNRRKEDKIRRKIAKFCISIPTILNENNYEDSFPNLGSKKKELLNKLKEYEEMSVPSIRIKFARKEEEIGKIVRLPDDTSLDDVKVKMVDYVRAHPLEKEVAPIIKPDAPIDRNAVIQQVSSNFFEKTGVKTNYDTPDQFYINNYVSSAINDLVPAYEPEKLKKAKWAEENLEAL